MSKIAVVILNWNGKQLLQAYLPGVIEHSPGAEIYVADNASEDGSVAYVRESFPTVKLIENAANWGFAKGYNEALKAVDADIYCLLNSDVEVQQGWLSPIREFMDKHPEAAIVQPKILDLRNKEKFEYAGAAGGYLDKFGYPFCRGRIFQSLEKDHGQYDDVQEVFWATGACMFIRREVYTSLQGFDEDYFAHQEEIDLCWRARNAGHRVYYVGTAAVYHLGGSTLSNMNPRKTFLNFRNSLFSITKNLPKRKAFPLVLARLILDLIAAIRFIFLGKFRHFWAVFRAHMSYYRYLPLMAAKRKKQSYLKKYYLVTSVVWSHFVNGIRTFNDLIKD